MTSLRKLRSSIYNKRQTFSGAAVSWARGVFESVYLLTLSYTSLCLILLVTTFITWETNVNQIIAYASRAFALYYMLQCCVALIVACQDKSIPGRHLNKIRFAILAIICLLVFALGLPSE